MLFRTFSRISCNNSRRDTANPLSVGAARIVKLWSQDGTLDGYLLEMRRQLDGSLSIQVLAPAESLEHWLAGRSSVSEIAGAIAKSADLRIPSADGDYQLRRDHTRVMISHSESKEARWHASAAEILIALKDLGRDAA